MKLKQRDKYHLHSRAAFFAHTNELVKSDDVEKAVDYLFKTQEIEDLCIPLPRWDAVAWKKKSQKQKREIKKKWRTQVVALNYHWIKQMMEPNKGLIEKMTLFWHGHFACSTRDNPYTTIEMNNLLRTNGLGNFRDLLFAVSKSAAMIEYLHLKQNRKGKPNEDFARELCELFTLGRDVGYSEMDVSEIARAFTGWATDQDGKHLVIEKHFDDGDKTIFGKTAKFTGEEVLNMILENPNCAKYIARKVYQFYVQEEVVEAHVEELASVFYTANYEISVLMKHLFMADWFYKSQGRIIKSPISHLVVLGKIFGLSFPDQKTIFRVEKYLGQVLFHPPNVAGWAGGKQWIDASRLALRLRLGSLILNKGYIMDELSPELDDQIRKGNRKNDIKFYEEIDWDSFWRKNKGTSIFDVLIRNENEALKRDYNQDEIKSVLRLISSPDFQLT